MADKRLGESLLLLDLGFLTNEITEIEQPGPTYFSFLQHLDLNDMW